MPRFCLLLLALLIPSPLFADPLQGRPDGDLLFYDIRQLGLEGQGWPDSAPFTRLPASAEKTVPASVWGLSRHSTGLCVRFRTDATSIQARWELTGKNLALPHMPATGVSGLDLYVRDEADRYRWLGVGRPSANPASGILTSGLPAGKMREFQLYLPLYNGVKSVEIGLARSAKLEKAPARSAHKKPIVFYGTSITQGGCASRPGMVHTAILGRRLDWPVINLGFSGSGKMEPALADLLGQIDASVYVLDCLPNMTPDLVTQRVEPFVLALRKTRPETPIVLVEDRSYANSHSLPAQRKRNQESRAALKKAHDKMFSEGVVSLHYLEGEKLLGDDGEDTVDGSHPTDLGFLRQADAMTPVLRFALPGPAPARAMVEGYPDHISRKPGETIAFHVSCAAKTFDVEIARIGAQRKVVWTKKAVPGVLQSVPRDASSHGCHWKESFRLTIPNDWTSGYYAVRFTAGPQSSEAFFVLRAAQPGKTSRILLQLSTNTYNAYCNWGGYSLYAYNGLNRVQGRRVSFERPIAGQFRNWELPFIQWAESAGYVLEYAVNGDLEHQPDLLKDYRLVLSVGHDEYWSSAMRDALERFIAAGGNVAFFSGNTCCWQVRSEEVGKALVCFKQAYKADPLYAKGERKLLSTLWSHHLIDRPENKLTGVGFLHGGYHRSHGQYMNGSGAFSVHRPDHWLFAGTKLKRREEFGGKDTIVGYECDGCELVWKDGLPQATGRDGTPKDFTVLATAPARWHPDDCEWYEKWEKGRNGNAVLGLYTAGGTVVTTGTTDWSHGLRGKDTVVIALTRNVLDRLGK